MGSPGLVVSSGTQNSRGVFGESEEDDEFGTSLATANFGKGSQADLAVGVPYEGTVDLQETGGVHVFYGSSNGLAASGSQFWTENSPGILGETEGGERFGLPLAASNS